MVPTCQMIDLSVKNQSSLIKKRKCERPHIVASLLNIDVTIPQLQAENMVRWIGARVVINLFFSVAKKRMVMERVKYISLSTGPLLNMATHGALNVALF